MRNAQLPVVAAKKRQRKNKSQHNNNRRKKKNEVQLGSEKLHLNCTCRRNLNEFYFSFFFFFLSMCISQFISHLMDSFNPYSINFEFDWPAFSVVEPHSSCGNVAPTLDKNQSSSTVPFIPFSLPFSLFWTIACFVLLIQMLRSMIDCSRQFDKHQQLDIPYVEILIITYSLACVSKIDKNNRKWKATALFAFRWDVRLAMSDFHGSAHPECYICPIRSASKMI